MLTVHTFFRKYRDLVISLVMIFISVMGTIFGIVPAISKVVSMRRNSVALAKTIQILRTKITILESQDENTYRDQLAQLVAAVPQDKSLPTLFATLDGLGAQSGVTLTEFTLSRLGSIASGSAVKLSAEEQKIGSSLLPFTIIVSGNYDQIYAFLSQVNSVRRFFRVNNFDISFANTSAITVHMGMDAFYSPFSTSIGAVDSPLTPLSQKEVDLITQISQMPYLGQAAFVPATSEQMPMTPKSDLFAP
jgi:Tfp pilus assembly protein PilO